VQASHSGGMLTLRIATLTYLGALLGIPVGLVFWRAFADGPLVAWEAVSRPAALHALGLTVLVVLIAVPANTVFGVLTALALARHRVPGKGLVSTLVDLPLALSPIVVGLALISGYGQSGWIGAWLVGLNIQLIFALPGIVLATILVSLPFVVREVVPVLHEIGIEQEEAARLLGASGVRTFWRVTLPSIRWAVAYGVVLTTARALGEFGAVSVVSGKLAGRTETLTLYVEERFLAFDVTGAYAASVLLALLAFATLLVMHFTARGEGAA
jgi:sulfate/thiosulfate transport system permease protein